MSRQDDFGGPTHRLPRWLGISVFFLAWGAIMLLVFMPRGALITLPGSVSHVPAHALATSNPASSPPSSPTE